MLLNRLNKIMGIGASTNVKEIRIDQNDSKWAHFKPASAPERKKSSLSVKRLAASASSLNERQAQLLRSALEAAEKRANDAESRIQNLERELATLKLRNMELADEVTWLKQQLTDHPEMPPVIRPPTSELKAKAKLEGSEIKQHDFHISQLEQQLRSYEEDIAKLKAAMAKQCQQLEAQVKDQRQHSATEVTSLQRSLAKAVRLNEDYESILHRYAPQEVTLRLKETLASEDGANQGCHLDTASAGLAAATSTTELPSLGNSTTLSRNQLIVELSDQVTQQKDRIRCLEDSIVKRDIEIAHLQQLVQATELALDASMRKPNRKISTQATNCSTSGSLHQPIIKQGVSAKVASGAQIHQQNSRFENIETIIAENTPVAQSSRTQPFNLNSSQNHYSMNLSHSQYIQPVNLNQSQHLQTVALNQSSAKPAHELSFLKQSKVAEFRIGSSDEEAAAETGTIENLPPADRFLRKEQKRTVSATNTKRSAKDPSAGIRNVYAFDDDLETVKFAETPSQSTLNLRPNTADSVSGARRKVHQNSIAPVVESALTEIQEKQQNAAAVFARGKSAPLFKPRVMEQKFDSELDAEKRQRHHSTAKRDNKMEISDLEITSIMETDDRVNRASMDSTHTENRPAVKSHADTACDNSGQRLTAATIEHAARNCSQLPSQDLKNENTVSIDTVDSSDEELRKLLGDLRTSSRAKNGNVGGGFRPKMTSSRQSASAKSRDSGYLGDSFASVSSALASQQKLTAVTAKLSQNAADIDIDMLLQDLN